MPTPEDLLARALEVTADCHGAVARPTMLIDTETVVALVDRLRTLERDHGIAQSALDVYIERLAVAEDDVEPAEEPESGRLCTTVRCECCGQTMLAGTRVASWWDDETGEVLAHWSRCPDPPMWVVHIEGIDWNDDDRAWETERGPMPFEEAGVIGGNFRRLPSVTRVTLRRVKETP